MKSRGTAEYSDHQYTRHVAGTIYIAIVVTEKERKKEKSIKTLYGNINIICIEYLDTKELKNRIPEIKILEMRGIEPRAFHMRSERSTTELHPLLT